VARRPRTTDDGRRTLAAIVAATPLPSGRDACLAALGSQAEMGRERRTTGGRGFTAVIAAARACCGDAAGFHGMGARGPKGRERRAAGGGVCAVTIAATPGPPLPACRPRSA